MANGSSNSLPWILAGVFGMLAAGAVGFVIGQRYSPETLAAQEAQANAGQLPPGMTTEELGAWTLVCQETGDKKVCSTATQIPVDASGRQMSLVLSGYGQNGEHAFNVRAPSAVELDKGLEFTIPGQKTEAFGFASCPQGACSAEFSMNDENFAKLSAAGSFEIAYTLLNGQRVAGNVSMKGLTEAFAKMDKPPPPPAAPAPAPAAPAASPAAPPAATPPVTPAPSPAPAPTTPPAKPGKPK